MPADIYNVCGITVGMEVGFVKLVYVGRLPEAGQLSSWGIEFLYLYGGWEEMCRDETPRGEADRVFSRNSLFFFWSFFF